MFFKLYRKSDLMENLKRVTKYHNDLNSVPMRTWTPEEQDFFFALLTQIRDEGTKNIRFNKYELANLAEYSIEHNERFKNTIVSLASKVKSMEYEEFKDENGRSSYELLPLFQRFYAEWANDLSDMFIEVKVSDEFEYVLNKLNIEFTGFDIKEFLEIRSTYAKTAYRLLKQWKTVGKKKFELDEFKRLFEIPKSYVAGDITKRVINPIRKELAPIFKNFKVKVIKANTRGNPVTGYLFTWTPEKTGTWDEKKFKKRSKKKETLPEWANKSVKSDKTIPEDEQQEMQERLKEFRNNLK